VLEGPVEPSEAYDNQFAKKAGVNGGQ
jgi:hypothetical protein